MLGGMYQDNIEHPSCNRPQLREDGVFADLMFAPDVNAGRTLDTSTRSTDMSTHT